MRSVAPVAVIYWGMQLLAPALNNCFSHNTPQIIYNEIISYNFALAYMLLCELFLLWYKPLHPLVQFSSELNSIRVYYSMKLDFNLIKGQMGYHYLHDSIIQTRLFDWIHGDFVAGGKWHCWHTVMTILPRQAAFFSSDIIYSLPYHLLHCIQYRAIVEHTMLNPNWIIISPWNVLE